MTELCLQWKEEENTTASNNQADYQEAKTKQNNKTSSILSKQNVLNFRLNPRKKKKKTLGERELET